MQFSEYISKNQVFTTADLLAALENAPSASVSLSRAAKTGKVAKVRSGLYVSQTGKFQGMTADPYRIASVFCKDVVFAYHSALELHGLAHTLTKQLQFMTSKEFTSFEFKGAAYKGLPVREDVLSEELYARAFGSIRTTTREQTFVDSFTKVGLAGGIEEVIRSFAGLPYLDIDVVLACLGDLPRSVAARVGWYLDMNKERWHVSDEMLVVLEQTLPKKASYKLDPTYKKFEGYSAKWHLSLPASATEINDWMEL